ncbi:hypothetical protein Purlil1_13574 [Purpureocillium lilacinum]|uniref:Uncharacterized protein n=1 Tax=Purpureocillium lilacinum TaxID=33203 RepID=A0ABR0BDN8_PURLI|nr:hypothetical protein Purlil1_13574 [Purpureocillium lilacinum]
MEIYADFKHASTNPKWYQGHGLYEYMSTNAFWLLGIFITVNACWTKQQVELFIGTENESKLSIPEFKTEDELSGHDSSPGNSRSQRSS